MVTKINAEITGSVWKIQVKVGDMVSEGDTLVVFESMKMEFPLESPVSGKVTDIFVAEGDEIEEGNPIISIEK